MYTEHQRNAIRGALPLPGDKCVVEKYDRYISPSGQLTATTDFNITVASILITATDVWIIWEHMGRRFRISILNPSEVPDEPA